KAENRGCGERVQPAAALDVRDMGGLGRHELARQPELLAQRDGVALLDEQRIRACVDREPLDLLAENHAARPARSLHEHEADTLPLQLVRCRQPCNPAPDDNSIEQGHQDKPSEVRSPSREWARSRSRAMKVGDVLSDAVRRSATPQSRATAAACTSRSKRISVWSHTNPIGTRSTRRRPAATLS